MAYRLERVQARGRNQGDGLCWGSESQIQLGWMFFFTPSRVDTEFWMAALVAASAARLGRVRPRWAQQGRAAGVAGRSLGGYY